jgi:hypothetical protein
LTNGEYTAPSSGQNGNPAPSLDQHHALFEDACPRRAVTNAC